MANAIDTLRENLDKARTAIRAAHSMTRFTELQLECGHRYFETIATAARVADDRIHKAQMIVRDELSEPDGQKPDVPLSVTLEELVAYAGAVAEIRSRRCDDLPCSPYHAKIYAIGGNEVSGEHAGASHAILVAFVELVRMFQIVDGELVKRGAPEADDVESE